MKNLKKRYWPLFSILLLVLAFFWKVPLLGKIPLPGDIITGAYLPWLDYKWGYPVGVPVKNPIVSDSISYSYPMRTLGIDLIKKGLLPLWNPYILNGTPLLANFQSAPFSPTNIFYFIFDNLTAWSWQVIAQHFLAFLFCYILLRHWRISKLGSLVGGFSFAFSGFMIIWSQWGVHSLVTSFIPLLVYLADKFFQTQKYRYGLGLSLILCMQIFSGYPQIVMYTLLGLGLFWMVRIIGSRGWLIKSFLFGVFIALGLGLASMQLIPANELIDLSQRKMEPVPIDWVFLHLDETITLLAPDYFGNHATANYWGPKNYLATIGFIGVVPIVLAIAGLRSKKRKDILYLLGLVVVSWVLALKTPLSYFLWEKNIVGLQAGISYKSLVLFTFAVSALVGFGFDNLVSKLKSRKYLLAPLGVPWLVLGGWGLWTLKEYFRTKATADFYRLGIPKYEVALRNLILPFGVLVGVTLVLLIIQRFKKLKTMGMVFLGLFMVIELFRFGWKFTPFVDRKLIYPTTPVIDFLQEKKKDELFRVLNKGDILMPVNQNMAYRLEFLGGYDGVYPLVSAEFIGILNSGDIKASQQDRFGIVSNPESRLTNLMNMKFLLVETGTLFDKTRFEEVFVDKSVMVLENKQVLPRAFMVYDWEVEGSKEKVMGSLLDPKFDLGKKVILEENVSMNRIGSSQPKNTVEYTSYQEVESLINVETQSDGLLFVSDTYYPGWKAYIDGQEEKILRADYAFKAIPVSKGAHQIKLVYKPDSFSKGLKASSVSLGLILLIGAGYFLARGRRRVYTL